MPAIVAIPQVVEEILLQFGDLFPNQPARVHLAEYITGLIVADRKTVSGISREFAATTDQSCLNRWLTDAKWDVDRINAHRLEWLQQNPTMRYYQDGVIAIDNTLIHHDGMLIEDVGMSRSSAAQSFVFTRQPTCCCTSTRSSPVCQQVRPRPI
jgi:hypothetical protein